MLKVYDLKNTPDIKIDMEQVQIYYEEQIQTQDQIIASIVNEWKVDADQTHRVIDGHNLNLYYTPPDADEHIVKSEIKVPREYFDDPNFERKFREAAKILPLSRYWDFERVEPRMPDGVRAPYCTYKLTYPRHRGL